jgi:hypothetical protein
MSNSDWVPTARLRFVEREVPLDNPGQLVTKRTVRILQQYWAQDVPGYMRKRAEGGWRDVEIEEETAP